MTAASYDAIMQDVRAELGHGHPIEEELKELKRMERSIEAHGASRDKIQDYRDRAYHVKRMLSANGLGGLGSRVMERAGRHHPDKYEHGSDPEFDFVGDKR